MKPEKKNTQGGRGRGKVRKERKGRDKEKREFFIVDKKLSKLKFFVNPGSIFLSTINSTSWKTMPVFVPKRMDSQGSKERKREK